MITSKSAYKNSPYCIFLSNFAKFDGGALYIQINSEYLDSKNCIFYNNSAIKNGGALFIYR
jgi:predicted outer membrane repeat protein